MDERPTSGHDTPPGPRSTARGAVWRQWVVPASCADVLASLADPAAAARTGLRLDAPAPTAGTLTATSRRWHGTWHLGRREGTAEVELTALSPTSTLVELCLGATPGAFAAAGGRWPRSRVVGEVARILGVAAPRRSRPVEPAVLRLTPPRRAGQLPALAWVALALLALAPTAWALIAGQGPTAVTEERALTEHRTRLQQLTPQLEDRRGGGDQDPDAAAAAPAPPDDGTGADPASPAPADGEGGGPSADTGAGPSTAAEDVEPSPNGTDPTGGADEADEADPPEPPSVPEEGVYSYATDGSEAVAVPGGSRDYPRITTISVTRNGCGFVERWNVLEERWDERESCADGEMAAQTSYREFFGQAQRHEFVCEEERPEDPEVGESWTIACEADGSRLDGNVEMVGTEDLDVRSTSVPTVHLRLEGELSGELTGTQQSERWVAPRRGGLLIRETSRTRARVASPMGEVDYREDYRIELLDLRPRR